MPSRRFRASGPGRGSHRKLVWSSVDTIAQAPLASGFQNIDLLAPLRVAGASVLGSTAIRAHLALSTASAVSAGDHMYFGLFVGSLDEVGTFTAATGANVPNPGSEPMLDWMWWEHRYVDNGTTKYNYHAANNHIVVDVKSKRKVEELDQTLILSVAAPGVATVPWSFSVRGRVLVMLA